MPTDISIDIGPQELLWNALKIFHLAIEETE